MDRSTRGRSSEELPMFRARACYCILCALVGLAVAYLMLAVNVPAAVAQGPKGPISFINDVAPILKENCYACHDAKKRSGKFDMTTYEKMMAGGAAGEGITAGKHS